MKLIRPAPKGPVLSGAFGLANVAGISALEPLHIRRLRLHRRQGDAKVQPCPLVGAQIEIVGGAQAHPGFIRRVLRLSGLLAVAPRILRWHFRTVAAVDSTAAPRLQQGRSLVIKCTTCWLCLGGIPFVPLHVYQRIPVSACHWLSREGSVHDWQRKPVPDLWCPACPRAARTQCHGGRVHVVEAVREPALVAPVAGLRVDPHHSGCHGGGPVDDDGRRQSWSVMGCRRSE
jgi:hypothetical protein